MLKFDNIKRNVEVMIIKKLLYFLTLLILLVPLVSCGAKNPQANNNANTSTDSKITYTKEFSYLPSYYGANSTTYTPSNAKESLAKATYIIQNTKDTKVFEDYEALFKKDGWTITQEQPVASFSAKKGNHSANILIQIFGSDVKLTIQSK
ncbi:hypothetical protein [Desulfosporosinus sp. SB140]|uniref:hypothetical protein n=1 Tax=Desulfosporosinus paludis TaxID=3115649 RepID=UPI00389038D8